MTQRARTKIMAAILSASLALVACKAKNNGGTPTAGSGSGSTATAMAGSGSAAAPDPNAKTCPPGNVVKAGACAPVVTADKIAAIAEEGSKVDDLIKLLDKADDIAAPIELLNAIRGLDEYKKLAGGNDKFKAVERVVATLADATAQLHLLQAALKDGSIHLNNIKGELQTVLTSTGAAQKIEDVQAMLDKEVHGAIDGVTQQLTASIQKVLLPLRGQLDDVSDLVIGACAIVKMSSSSGSQVKELCGKAKEAFMKATVLLADLDKRPSAFIQGLTATLQSQLGDLATSELTKLLATAQQTVNDALKAPAPATGSGSAAAGSGSGSAAK